LKNVLVIGSGGREHALGWALSRSPQGVKLYFAAGNAGTATLPQAENLAIGAEDVASLTAYALDKKPDLVVVGPEVPLAAGLADRLREAGIAVFGPGAAGARLEASKSWAKAFMQRYGIPTAAQVTFEEAGVALAYLAKQAGPYVIKADGLAAGKGVLVTTDRAEAGTFAREALGGDLFGQAGQRILIEEFMSGVEVSVLALCDTVSKKIIPFEPACDYKRAFDGDQGPNTGGMGAYSPPGFMTPELRRRVFDEILQPTLDGLLAEGIDYRGIVYAGLMITAAGPKVVEYNCRFGDPETQSLMPRINSDMLEILEATAAGKLAELPAIEYKAGASVGVVLASGGYPGAYKKGVPVTGAERLDNQGGDIYLFHAGTAHVDNQGVVTAGGRVFNLIALGENLAIARQRVYNTIDEGVIRFEEMIFRRDIAAREVGKN
jgi:phosphoribosylamine--glycine ligase